MAVQINTNKANLSNKVLLYFFLPLKHTSHNLRGECLDLRSESFKSTAPLSSLFAVLRNSLILPHQWRTIEKSRLLYCQPLRVPVLFDNIFCGSFDTPPPPLLLIVCCFHYSSNQIQAVLGVFFLGGGDFERRFEGRIGKFVIS